uniref:Uncharacterized protein n=1 Tax=Avena sativa TaxID=4498 RepID=A0ACD5ZAL4_AVESA
MAPPDPSGRDYAAAHRPSSGSISNLRFFSFITPPLFLAPAHTSSSESNELSKSSESTDPPTNAKREESVVNEQEAMAELLFAPAVTGLLHLPDVLERLAAADADHRDHAHHQHAAHGHGQGQPRAHGGGAPVDIVETPGEYAFLLDVPGLSKSDIQVTLEEDSVLVMKSAHVNGSSNGNGDGNGAGKRKRDEEEGDCKYIRLERRASPRSFVRKFRLPEDADAGGVTARCENGVLTVTVKKQPPAEKKPKSVQVAIA